MTCAAEPTSSRSARRRRAITVVLADDDAVFRSALVDMLRDDGRFEVLGQASASGEVVDLVRRERPVLVVLDVRMPQGGAAAAREILADQTAGAPRPAIVALSAHGDPAHVLAMLRAGARSFVDKSELGLDLPDLLARAASGQAVLAVPGGAAVISGLLG